MLLDDSSTDYVTTKDGSLIIRTDAKKKSWIEKKNKKPVQTETDDDQYKHASKFNNNLIKEPKHQKEHEDTVKRLKLELEKEVHDIDKDFLALNNLELFTKNYTSGMVQSWNRFCFTGGLLEMSIKLPGKAKEGGRLYLRLSHLFFIFNFFSSFFRIMACCLVNGKPCESHIRRVYLSKNIYMYIFIYFHFSY